MEIAATGRTTETGITKAGTSITMLPPVFFTIQQTGINQNRKIILDLGLVYELLSRNGYR